MIDRKKIIEHLQIIRTWNKVGEAYAHDEMDKKEKAKTVEWIDDTLNLLKEQKPMQPKNIWHSIDHTSIRKNGDCPKCGGEVNEFDNSMLCGRCGQSLDWRNI